MPEFTSLSRFFCSPEALAQNACAARVSRATPEQRLPCPPQAYTSPTELGVFGYGTGAPPAPKAPPVTPWESRPRLACLLLPSRVCGSELRSCSCSTKNTT